MLLNCLNNVRVIGSTKTRILSQIILISSNSNSRLFSKTGQVENLRNKIYNAGNTQNPTLRKSTSVKQQSISISTSTMTALSRQSETQSKSKTEDKEVLFEAINGKGIITLNRVKALNALNLSMARTIYPVLREWESSQNLVIIKANGGKAFCAGGDVRVVTESAKSGTSACKDFFRSEYELNGLIGTLHVPYIALIDGITMGGGVGLSVHGRYRVATENTLFAMPEMTIGLFPDVGGSYFLPRLGGKLGFFLALTGYRLKGGDVFKSGVATHMCPSHMLSSLEQDLLSISSISSKTIEEVLNKYHQQSSHARVPFTLEANLPKINTIFSGNTIEEIISRLEAENSDWSKGILETFSKVSPTSLKISLKLLELGSQMDLQECLKMEYRLAVRCCDNHDFIEGVRALLVDKDQKPQWKPSTLDKVTPQLVDAYFEPLPAEMELNL